MTPSSSIVINEDEEVASKVLSRAVGESRAQEHVAGKNMSPAYASHPALNGLLGGAPKSKSKATSSNSEEEEEEGEGGRSDVWPGHAVAQELIKLEVIYAHGAIKVMKETLKNAKNNPNQKALAKDPISTLSLELTGASSAFSVRIPALSR